MKKLKAVRELKSKKDSGEKLSLDQLMKLSKEGELLKDLKKLGYEVSNDSKELEVGKDPG